MVASFLLSYRVLNSALIIKNDDFAFVCTEAINKIFEISQNYKDQVDLCSVYSPSQTLDKIEGGLNEEQKVRLFNAIKRENATLGVPGFNPEDLETLSESAKNLSFSKYAIILLAEDMEKNKIHNNSRIRAVTPRELLDLLNKSQDLYDIFLSSGSSDIDQLDCVLMVFFKEGVYEKVKAIMCNSL